MNVGIKTVGELAKIAGMPDDNMKEFLEGLVKKKQVKKEGEEYSWIKDERKE